MLIVRRLAAVVLAALPFAAPCLARNLLQNPGFGTDLTGWSADTTAVSVTWDSRDVNGSPASGSALVTNAQSGPGSDGIKQCVAVESDLTYMATGYARVPSGQATPGGALLLVQWYTTAGCASGFISNATFPRVVTATDEWQQITLTHLYPPASAKYAAVAAYPSKDTSGGSFQVYYDDLSFGVEALGRTITIPASASIHGAQGAFFHSDVWISNRSYKTTTAITARLRCLRGTSCDTTQRLLVLGPRKTTLLADAVGTFFQSPESAGAIELASDESPWLTVGSRVYTPSLPDPTFGASIPGLPSSAARGRALFNGVAGSGADRATGFRSNVGVYNPGSEAASVTFTLLSADGGTLGTPRTEVVAPNEAYQVNDVFANLGAGSVVTVNAVLIVSANAPVFSYLTVIDNQTNDSTIVLPAEDVAP